MTRKYALKFAKDAPVDEDFLTFADTLFAEMNLSPEMAQLAASRWQDYTGKRLQQDMLSGQAAADREVAALKTSLGKDYDARIAAGKKAVKSLGMSAAELDALERSIGLAPVINLLGRLGQHMSNGGAGPAAPEQAATTLDELKRDSAFQKSLRDKLHPKHDENLRQWEAAHAAAHPAKEVTAAPSATPAPFSFTQPAAATPTSRDQARSEIARLSNDKAFQDTMRNQQSPDRAAAVEQWQGLHAAAHAPPAPEPETTQ